MGRVQLFFRYKKVYKSKRLQKEIKEYEESH